MTKLFSKKLFMMGLITITLPFGTFTLSGTGQVVQQIQPVVVTQPTAVNSGVSSNTSLNWSGYEATGGTFTAVSGSWIVPTVPSATSTQADATWIGIGGLTGQDLIQAGTQAVINGSGAPTYEAWYEMLPQATTQVPLTVSGGDSMSASLTETSAATQTSPAEWSVSIRDNTTGQSYQTSLAYNSSLSSAEWIEEMPTDGTQLVPLDNFGTASFSNGMTTENGDSETIAGAGAQAITMVNNADQALASPSALGSDGESFVVTRTAAVASTSSGFGGGQGGGFGPGGLGRGWRRTGVGVRGYQPRSRSTTSATGTPAVTTGSVGGSTTGTGRTGYGYFQRFSRMFQQLQQFQQQVQRNNRRF